MHVCVCVHTCGLGESGGEEGRWGEPPKTFPKICSAWLHRSGSFPTQTGLPEELELGPPESTGTEKACPAPSSHLGRCSLPPGDSHGAAEARVWEMRPPGLPASPCLGSGSRPGRPPGAFLSGQAAVFPEGELGPWREGGSWPPALRKRHLFPICSMYFWWRLGWVCVWGVGTLVFCPFSEILVR